MVRSLGVRLGDKRGEEIGWDEETNRSRIDRVKLDASREVALEVGRVDIDRSDGTRCTALTVQQKPMSQTPFHHRSQWIWRDTYSLMMAKSRWPGVLDRLVSQPSPMSFLFMFVGCESSHQPCKTSEETGKGEHVRTPD